MPKMHLKLSEFTHVALKQRKNKKLKETGDTRYIYQNELDKDYFKNDMTYGAYKDLPRRTTSDKVLRNKAFATASNSGYDR